MPNASDLWSQIHNCITHLPMGERSQVCDCVSVFNCSHKKGHMSIIFLQSRGNHSSQIHKDIPFWREPNHTISCLRKNLEIFYLQIMNLIQHHVSLKSWRFYISSMHSQVIIHYDTNNEANERDAAYNIHEELWKLNHHI